MRAKLNGTEIYFDTEGSELEISGNQLVPRPTLIALHGGPGFDHGYLRPGLSPLSRQAQVVYVDLRGQGRSTKAPLDSCSLEQMANDVAALCELVGIEQPVVFGHSAGGFVALHLAIRHPRLARALILCDTAPTLAPIDDGASPPSLESRAGSEAIAVARRLFSGDMSPEVLMAFSEKVMPFYAAPSHMDVPGRVMSLSRMNVELSQYFFAALAAQYDLRPALSSIAIPALVVFGRYDWVCTPAASRAIGRAIRGAELIELEDSGHFPFSEEPERFQQVVSTFLKRVTVR